MLIELSVENIAIIDRSTIELESGFTVLTGETGAGKSLLIDAIELALGERADFELVRTGATKASVSLAVSLAGHPNLLQSCRELGVDPEGDILFIQREVLAEGRSQCRINGKLAPVSQLRQIGRLLVDLHGQHDHQSLLDPLRHIGFLDDWIGQAARDLLAAVREAHLEAEEARSKLRALQSGMRDREHRLDLLRFQIAEIEAAEPRPGEMEELDVQLSRLKNAERLAQGSAQALALLRDDDGCAIDQLRSALKTVEDLARFDSSLESIAQPLREGMLILEDGIYGLSSYQDGLEADPSQLEQIAERMDTLKRLRRKYGESEEAVLEFYETSQQELALLENAEANQDELAEQVENAEKNLLAAAGELSQLRQEKSTEFSHLVEQQLRELAMERARFQVMFRPKAADSSGIDDVEFFFSANAGEPPRPLGKIASGGEISRVMLGIKTAMAGRAGVPTLIFDEVDAGLGGKAAATVARKLEELAKHYQVIVISHLPQIAARATTHFRIEKAEQAGRVVTDVRFLQPDERTEEIARMLVGDALTDTALASARELLAR